MRYLVQRYKTPEGGEPYTEWLKKLRRKDPQGAVKIDTQVARATAGNFGDHKFERGGVWAIRMDVGPGFRIYYSVQNGEILLLLIGGTKRTQDADIDKAVSYLSEYKARPDK